ncbi:FAD-dependent oxidoreductase [Parvularcula lutaonensis]|uniref:FAD-dependent oxidoreductase n=1 Tax=Parvularcula lutaonensis TaxID=491923 RepID=A0ABV7MDN8_9PROT|nr:FAD-dependent oxidoreductase [Parvularcula lutaonensis]GGY52861.1 pyridine nucleotide-disulfide oxidoreductase [Parvularcula lutaonensis]
MPRYDLGAISQFAEDTPTKASTACRDLVVVRRGDVFFVLDHDCQHLGAPLSEAIIEDDCLVCPWHRALIRLSDGFLQEPPGCRHHKRYEAILEDGRLKVDIEPSEPSYRDQEPKPEADSRGHPKSIIILGAGAAGLSAAQSLAEHGYNGALTLVSHEAPETYDRTTFTKSIVGEPEEAKIGALTKLRDGWLDFEYASAEKVDLEERRITFEDGRTISAEVLILATGAEPRRLDIPGAELGGVLTIRDLSDALALSERVEAIDRAVIIGAGFIGMEAAATLCGEDIDVSIVAREELPFAKIFGERVAKRLLREQTDAGVNFFGGSHVQAIEGDDGSVTGVRLADGRRLDAGLVIMAVGVSPCTDILAGASRNDDRSLSVDETLAVMGFKGVYAAGDVARLPTRWGELRSEHWRWAQQLGRRAAVSALGGSPKEEDIAPFFWTKQHAPGSYVYIGHTEDFDDIVYEGDPDEGEFIAFYLDQNRCPAILALGMADRVSRIERLMARHGPLTREVLGI